MKTIKELVENKEELIAFKKAEIKHVKGGLSNLIKAKGLIGKNTLKEDTDKEIERTFIGNTYLWLDSHDDVHAKSCFKKSISERQKDIFHLHDHEFKIVSKVGDPIKIYEDSIKWRDLGIDKDGETEALFMDSLIKKSYNENIFNGYKDGKINQHSVGMQYVKIDLAVNDSSYEEEFKVWTDNIDKIGNKEKAEENGYFWFIREAKLIEISAVLLGSNELTPTMEDKKQAGANPLDKNEPSKDTQANKLIELLTNIKIN